MSTDEYGPLPARLRDEARVHYLPDSADLLTEAADEIERLRAALRAVVALHERVLDGYLMTDVCAECSDPEEGRWTIWPCATSDAIEAALSGRGDAS